MNPFTYSRATDANQAVAAVSRKPQTKFLGGGTNLIDLMKMGVEVARNSDVAEHELIKTRYPVLSEALLSGASPQLRNMATAGGNLLQRTR